MQISEVMIIAASSYVSSLLVKSATNVAFEKGIEMVSTRLYEFAREFVSSGKSVDESESFFFNAESKDDLRKEAENVFAASSVLKRAQLISPVIKGSRILWIDDNPRFIEFERITLEAFGSIIDPVTTSETAFSMLTSFPYDLVISDIDRPAQNYNGLKFLTAMREKGFSQEVIFYILYLDRAKGVPPGSFGITNHPDELYHLVMDILVRNRI